MLKFNVKNQVKDSKCNVSNVEHCTGCAKKKKDILNIYVKSQIINIFF